MAELVGNRSGVELFETTGAVSVSDLYSIVGGVPGVILNMLVESSDRPCHTAREAAQIDIREYLTVRPTHSKALSQSYHTKWAWTCSTSTPTAAREDCRLRSCVQSNLLCVMIFKPSA